MSSLSVAASAVDIPVDDSMVIGGSILPGWVQGQEAPLRASAVIIEADTTLCIISSDVLGVSRDIADAVADRIAADLGIPFENTLITATHTHHAPTTFTVHGYEREEGFCDGLADAMVEAARAAMAQLRDQNLSPNSREAEFGFAVGNEATWGANSRVLLKDGTVGWYGFSHDEIVRPTGPFDPDLPVIAFLRPDDSIAATLFNHSTHNIGATGPGRSPAVYGLTAQAAERRHSGNALFLPGAFGSSHNMGLPAEEGIIRLSAALDDALATVDRGLRGPVAALKKPFRYEIRHFDEAAEDAAVRQWCERWYDAQTVETYAEVFRKMRAQLEPMQGTPCDTWLQVIRLGEVAIVGIPGEMFASLGLAIKRRSPFRHTVVVGLANDEVGYIPDSAGYAFGGYQLWTGLHSVLPQGTGERMVDAVVQMLEELHGTPQLAPSADSGRPGIRPVREGDAAELQSFYNGLSPASRRLFRPLGWNASFADAKGAVDGAVAGERYDIVMEDRGKIVGWAFLMGMNKEFAHLGIGIADAYCSQGLGRDLMANLTEAGRSRGLKGVDLIVVQQNDRARKLYERYGFVVNGTQQGPDGLEYYSMRLEY
jgi:ribosomal protein S18 acetylase RimI-like enzyme